MANYVNNSTIVSALTAYVDQLGFNKILTESVFSARTAKIATIQTGVKGTQAINLITSQPVFQAAQCGLISGSGSVTLSQQNITVADIMVYENICYYGANTLSKMYTGMLMKEGIRQEDITPDIFAKAYIADKANKIMDYNEKSLWLGSTGTPYNSAYTLSNGFLYNLYQTSASASIIIGATAYAGALTKSTTAPIPSAGSAIDVINQLTALIPEAIADKPTYCFMNLTNYRTLVNDLVSVNNYHIDLISEDHLQKWEFQYPYYPTMTIVATSGLTGRNDIVITYAENMFIGVDSESDDENFHVWESADLNSVNFRAMWRLGTAIAYPQYVVVKNA